RRVDKHVTDRLQDILRDHHGEAEVHLKLTAAGHETVIRLDRTWDVEPCTELFGDLQAAFGTTCLAA
ncbi:MAG: hypothetical protein LBM66_03010, partial [Bifidobacteriaceae bacterium]|nr:hypothetical protein [Bifidobacteriaceae bacterium]